VSPSFAVALSRLLLADASREAVERCLAQEADTPPLEAVLALGERARGAGASEEQTALALGILDTLRAAEAAAP
jgi:hypothetical protein